MERLQKVIANSGLCSRRKAEDFIRSGRVTVDGKVVTELGTKVSEKNKIEVDHVILENSENVYFLLNKPRGVITSTHDEKNRKTVIDLIPIKKRIYPIGRLDYDTTGALLLTNDGTLANLLMHPKSEIDKVYLAKVKGIMKADAVYQLKEGVILDGVKVLASKVKIKKVDAKTNHSFVEITIHEGKNHQVKRMLESVGFPVEKLTRIKIAFLNIHQLASGEYRKLSHKEVSKLYLLANKNNKK